MITLVDLYEFENRPREGALQFLYDLMAERMDAPYISISHAAMPTWEQHVNFVCGRPNRAWFLITAKQNDLRSDSGIWVGYVSATHSNEIGIVLRKEWRGRGFGTLAVRRFIDTMSPAAAIPGQRVGAWLANINPYNVASTRMFQKLGFTCAQVTYRLDLSKGLEDKSGTASSDTTVKIEHQTAIEEGTHEHQEEIRSTT